MSNEVSEVFNMEYSVVLVHLDFNSTIFAINKTTHAILVPFVSDIAVLIVE